MKVLTLVGIVAAELFVGAVTVSLCLVTWRPALTGRLAARGWTPTTILTSSDWATGPEETLANWAPGPAEPEQREEARQQLGQPQETQAAAVPAESVPLQPCKAGVRSCQIIVVQAYEKHNDALVRQELSSEDPNDPKVFTYGSNGWADSAASVLAYAKANGYVYRLYTFDRCVFNTGILAACPHWCKLQALYNAQLDFPKADWFFYVDNDVWFVNRRMRIETIVAEGQIIPGSTLLKQKDCKANMSSKMRAAQRLFFLSEGTKSPSGCRFTSSGILVANSPTARATLQEWWTLHPPSPGNHTCGREGELHAFKTSLQLKLIHRFGVIHFPMKPGENASDRLLLHACTKRSKRPYPCMKLAWGDDATKPEERERLIRQVLDVYSFKLSLPWA